MAYAIAYLEKINARERLPESNSMPLERKTRNRILHQDWSIFLVLAFVITLTYVSVLVLPYAFGDDYAFLWNAKFSLRPMTDNISAGRPIMGLLLQTGFSLVTDIGSLRYLRLVSILEVVLLSFLLIQLFGSIGLRRYTACLLALLIVFLHSFQVYVSWSQYFVAPLACIFAVTAAQFAHQAGEKESFRSRLVNVLISIVVLFLALMTYQPAAMLFWVVIAIRWLGMRGDFDKGWRMLLISGAVGVTAMMLEYVSLHLVTGWLNLPTDLRANLRIDPIEKLNWFFQEPLVQALNFTKVQPSTVAALVTGVLIAVGLFIFFEGNFYQKAAKYLISLAFIPLSYAPSLIVVDSFASYRTTVALSVLLLTYAFFAFKGYLSFAQSHWVFPAEGVLDVVLSGTAAAFIFFAAHNVLFYFGLPQVKEFAILRSELQQIDLENTSQIWVIRPDWTQGATDVIRHDEFGKPNIHHAWAVEPMVRLALGELDISEPDTPVSSSAHDEEVPELDDIAVIDMRILRFLR